LFSRRDILENLPSHLVIYIRYHR